MKKKSNVQTPLTKSLNHELKSAQLLYYEDKDEPAQGKSNTTKNLKIQNKRFEKLECEMALVLKYLKQQHTYKV